MPEIIDKKTVEEIAVLARLGLTEDEIAEQVPSLNDVLSHFSTIQQINTKDTPASDDVTGLTNVTRPDQALIDPLCPGEILLDQAPATLKRQIKVPAVF